MPPRRPASEVGTAFAMMVAVQTIIVMFPMTNARTFAFDGYTSHFNESALWRKLKKVAGKVGRKAVYHVLVLYYVARDPAVPTSLKIKVFGALGYFILPLDFIPDAILGLGFTDDILALAWAVFSLRKYPRHQGQGASPCRSVVRSAAEQPPERHQCRPRWPPHHRRRGRGILKQEAIEESPYSLLFIYRFYIAPIESLLSYLLSLLSSLLFNVEVARDAHASGFQFAVVVVALILLGPHAF